MKKTFFLFVALYSLFCINAQAQSEHPLNGIWKNQGETYKFNYIRGVQFVYHFQANPSVFGESGVCELVSNTLTFYSEGKTMTRQLPFKSISPFKIQIGHLTYEWVGRFKGEVQQTPERVETPTIKRAVVTRINITRIPDTKPSGAAWDTYLANYKPDVYAIIKSPTGSELWRSSGRHDDLSNAQCPVSFTLSNIGGLKIPTAYFKNTYYIEIWDMDNTSYHDEMFMGQFTISSLGFDAKKIYFNDKGFEIELELSWE